MKLVIKTHGGVSRGARKQGIRNAVSTVQLTGNVAGIHTMRHASTRETREGAGMLRGIASKTKITREFNYS